MHAGKLDSHQFAVAESQPRVEGIEIRGGLRRDYSYGPRGLDQPLKGDQVLKRRTIRESESELAGDLLRRA